MTKTFFIGPAGYYRSYLNLYKIIQILGKKNKNKFFY